MQSIGLLFLCDAPQNVEELNTNSAYYKDVVFLLAALK